MPPKGIGYFFPKLGQDGLPDTRAGPNAIGCPPELPVSALAPSRAYPPAPKTTNSSKKVGSGNSAKMPATLSQKSGVVPPKSATSSQRLAPPKLAIRPMPKSQPPPDNEELDSSSDALVSFEPDLRSSPSLGDPIPPKPLRRVPHVPKDRPDDSRVLPTAYLPLDLAKMREAFKTNADRRARANTQRSGRALRSSEDDLDNHLLQDDAYEAAATEEAKKAHPVSVLRIYRN
jgi:hypothetical protein